MNLLANAIAFAANAHIDQVDKGGNAYILHPIRIMMRLRTTDEELMAIAILHDTLEDCGIDSNHLRQLGMTERVIAGVEALTKMKGESYEDFIERICQNRDAMFVKREDLRDNSDLTRLKGLREKDFKRMEKYMKAFKKIDDILKEGC